MSRVCKPWFPNRGSRLPAEQGLKRGKKRLNGLKGQIEVTEVNLRLKFERAQKGGFDKNVPSFRFFGPSFRLLCPRSGFFVPSFRFLCALVPVLRSRKHQPKPPFWKPPFANPPKWVAQANLVSRVQTKLEPSLGNHH